MEKLNFRDKVGYGMGDVSIGLFWTVTAYLQIFYTDILFIDLKKIMVLFVVARVWDVINDPIIGVIVDTRASGKHGKYRGFMRFFSYFLAIATICCFVVIPNLTDNMKLLYAYISYIMFGMFMTCVAIPYGALASAITNDLNERASLSAFRSLGAGIGGGASIFFPLFVFTKVGNTEVLNHNMLFLGMTVVAALGLIMMQISVRWTKERIITSATKKDPKIIFKTIMDLLKNRSYLAIIIIGMIMLSMGIAGGPLGIIVYRNYFGDVRLITIAAIIGVVPSTVMLPVALKLVQKYGKKEVCSLGLLFATIMSFVLFIIKTTNPYVYIAFIIINVIGATFINTQIWALIGDVINHHEYKYNTRNEAICYSFIMFGRRLGWAVGGLLSTLALAMSKYVVDQTTHIATVDNNLLYAWVTLIPFFGNLLSFLLLQFLYPLNKKKMKIITDELNIKYDLKNNEV